MFGFSLTAWLVAGGIVLTTLAGTHWKAYRSGEQHIQKAWDIDKGERLAAQATADENERLKGHAAALDYERWKQAQQPRTVIVTREVSHALEIDGSWAQQSVPRGVRDAIAAAVGQASAASQPDRALRLPAAGNPEQRPVGPGLRASDSKPRGLFGPPR